MRHPRFGPLTIKGIVKKFPLRLPRKFDRLEPQKDFLYRVLVNTQAFKQFFRTQKNKIDFEKLSAYEQHQILRDFFWEEAGEQEAQKIGLDNLDRWPVKVIPNSKLKIKKGIVDILPHLREGRFLTLEIDLTYSQTELVEHIKNQIKRYSPHVAKTPKTRGISIEEPSELDKMFLAYYLIEAGLTIEQTMWRIFPKTKGKTAISTESYRKQIARWHKKVTDHITGNSRP